MGSTMHDFKIGDKVVSARENSLSRQIMTVTSKPYRKGLMVVNVTNSRFGRRPVRALKLATEAEIKAESKLYGN